MRRKLTQSEKTKEANRKAIGRMRKGAKETAELHEQVRRGEKTAAQALREKCGFVDKLRSVRVVHRVDLVERLADLADQQAMLAVDVIRFPELMAGFPPDIDSPIADLADHFNHERFKALVKKYGANRLVLSQLPQDVAEAIESDRILKAQRAEKARKG